MSQTVSVIVFFVGMFIYLAIRTSFKRKLSGKPKAVNKSSNADMSLVLLVGLSQIGIPALFTALPMFVWANHSISVLTALAGGALMLCGLWLFWRSHVDLGENWSVSLELEQKHRLVTIGVYRLIRHPMYASFFLMALAQAALLPNWISGFAAFFAVSLLYIIRKPHEEAMMLSHFGLEYETYMRNSGGIIPKTLAKKRSPDQR
jgi:protein-S-isoprenylcysteine O-methyltransferase Ste14